jgi:hypothetical protein
MNINSPKRPRSLAKHIAKRSTGALWFIFGIVLFGGVWILYGFAPVSQCRLA